MIHLSKTLQANYLYFINKIRNNYNWKFIFASLLPILFIFLVQANIIPSKAKYSSSIVEPVALLVTPTGTGSAFLVGTTHLITARHVVDDIEEGAMVDLIFDKANPKISTSASLLWKDKTTVKKEDLNINDFAVLKLINPADLPENFPRLQLGLSAEVELMSKVILIGYPNGDFSNTGGQISNTELHGLDVFKIDAAAWGGNSGGPLIDAATNEVIGILGGGMEEPFKGINFAYKIDNALKKIQASGIDIYN